MLISGDEKTAVIYARVSTSRQADDGLPLESQIERCEAKAEQLGARVVKCFVDGGISGRVEQRPEFQAAIDYCETYGPSYLITWSTSRFARDRGVAYLYKQRLARAGVDIAYVSVDIDRSDDSGMLLEGVFELLDEWQSHQTSKDTTRSMVRNAQRGYWNGARPPFGYETRPAADDERRKRLQPNESEAWIVRRIFDMRLSGPGVRRIAQQLNADGIDRRGSPWKPNAVTEVLRGRANIGQIVYGRKDRKTGRRKPESDWIIIDSHEPIVDIDKWQQVRELMDAAALDSTSTESGGAARSQHALTGLLVCGECGSAMHIETAHGRSKAYAYYRCRSAQLRDGCDTGRLSADALDEWVLGLIGNRIFTVENLRGVVETLRQSVESWQNDQTERRRQVARELSAIEAGKQKLYGVLELHGKDTPNLGDLTRRLRTLNADTERLELEMARIDREDAPRLTITDAVIEDVAEMLKALLKESERPQRLRAFLKSFIARISSEKGGIRIEYRESEIIRASQSVHSKTEWLPGTVALRTAVLREKWPARLAGRFACRKMTNKSASTVRRVV